jgi:deoxyribonuclease V
VSAIETVSFPYIPGLLSFREGPALTKAFEKLVRIPDMIIFDGQGIAHPRGIGLASHMGLILDIPAIGCAKSLLVGHHEDVGEEPGAWEPLLYQERLVGAALRTKKKVKPVFVSQGYKIGLEQALDVVMHCCRGYRLPEPTRQAHLAVNKLRESVNGR